MRDQYLSIVTHQINYYNKTNNIHEILNDPHHNTNDFNPDDDIAVYTPITKKYYNKNKKEYGSINQADDDDE